MTIATTVRCPECGHVFHLRPTDAPGVAEAILAYHKREAHPRFRRAKITR